MEAQQESMGKFQFETVSGLSEQDRVMLDTNFNLYVIGLTLYTLI